MTPATGVLSYLEEVHQELSSIKNGLLSENERLQSKALLLENVLTECNKEAVAILCDKDTSLLFESLLEDIDSDALLHFLNEITKTSLVTISCNPFGSHVIEHILELLFGSAQVIEAGALSFEVLENLCAEVCEDIERFLTNKFATHIVRRLVCLLSGVHAADYLNKFKTRHRNAQTKPQLHRSIKPKSGLKTTLFLIFDALFGLTVLDTNSALLFLSNPIACPTLQVALIALSVVDRHRFRAFARSLMGASEMTDSINKESVLLYMKGKCASHFMEILISVAPKSLLDELIEDCFLEHCLALSLHPFANFSLQTAIDYTKSNDSVRQLMNQLGSHFAEIIMKNRTGVIVSLMKKSQEIGEYGKDCCQFVQQALRSMIVSNSGNLCEVLLTCSTSAELGDNFSKLSHKGCILLETLFHFPQEFVSSILKDLKSMSDQKIRHIANDSCGARILERFFRNSMFKAKIKKVVLTKLSGEWTQLAMSSSGSHLLEACFDFAKPDLRKEILHNLEINRVEICKSTWGAATLKHCHGSLSASVNEAEKTTKVIKQKERTSRIETMAPKRQKRQDQSTKASFISPSYGLPSA